MPGPQRRSDARRNEQSLLEAAAAAFVEAGVEARVRDIAERAGVGVGTVYRHFPTRADLIVAVYRHQIDACVLAGDTLPEEADTPYGALAGWVDLFVDFVATKHGLAAALRADGEQRDALHSLFVERLVPVCDRLLAAAADEIRPGISAFELMFAVGNLCAFEGDPRYDARKMVRLLVAGLRRDG